MKKTIIALLALGYTAAAAGVVETEYFTFTTDENGNPNPVQLDNEYDLTKDWTLSFSCVASPKVAANEWGTAIISSETVPTEAIQNIQIYAPVGGTNVILKANNGDNTYSVAVTQGASGWGSGYEYLYGSLNYTLEYTAADKSITLKITDGTSDTVNKTWSNVTFGDTDTLTKLTTGITSTQLGEKVTIAGQDAPLWTLPSGSFTGTALNIPEPTTATLSLLALAGLAARRRRR